MVLGLSISAFTTLHVAISLVAIAAGLVVLAGMLAGRRLPVLTAQFLATTVATSVTGFLFPITAFTPALAVGAISLAILAVALLALYGFRLAGAWRPVYVVSAIAALYLNVFVAVVQAFQKLEALQPLAPTQSEPPFLAAQGTVLGLFVVLGFLAAVRFRPADLAAPLPA
jgi:hypothetical protein